MPFPPPAYYSPPPPLFLFVAVVIIIIVISIFLFSDSLGLLLSTFLSLSLFSLGVKRSLCMCLTSTYCLQCYSELTERHFNPSSSSSSASTRREGKEREMKRAVYPLHKWMMNNNNNRVYLFTITVFGL